jgi:hypothetical protein
MPMIGHYNLLMITGNQIETEQITHWYYVPWYQKDHGDL